MNRASREHIRAPTQGSWPPPKDALEPAVDPALASALEFEPLTLQAIDDETSGGGLDGICEGLSNGLGGLSSPPPPTLEEILADADYREEEDEIDGDDPARFAFSSANSSTTARSLLDTLSLHSRGSGDSRSRTSASGRSGVSGRSRASRARARGLKAAQGSTHSRNPHAKLWLVLGLTKRMS